MKMVLTYAEILIVSKNLILKERKQEFDRADPKMKSEIEED